jgi:alpha-beta hydrolase superfamily lysophospholipase
MLITVYSCNGVFYQPSAQIFYTPADQEIDFVSMNFKTADNVLLSAWLLKTPTKPIKGTIIHFHGNAENMTSHFMFSGWLVEHGYQVVTFDYRGYGSSQSEPSRAGTIEDGKAVIQGVCAHAAVQGHPVFILGQSLGGAVAIPSLVLSGTKDCIRGIVLDSTFASYRDIAQKVLGSFWLTWPLQLPLSYLVSDELSAKDYINKLKLPTIFIHSKTDPVIPFECGLDLYETSTDPSKKFWSLTERAHTLAFASPTSPFRPQLVRWLDNLVEQEK